MRYGTLNVYPCLAKSFVDTPWYEVLVTPKSFRKTWFRRVENIASRRVVWEFSMSGLHVLCACAFLYGESISSNSLKT